MKQGFKDFIQGAIVGLFGTGLIGVVGYTFIVPLETTLEDLGTEDPSGTISAMSSEGSVGEASEGLTAIPGDITSENPVGGTAVGILGIGASAMGTTTTTNKPPPPPPSGEVRDENGNILGYWVNNRDVRKDTMPYSALEKRADMLYKRLHGEKMVCYRYPAIIADSAEAYQEVRQLFGGYCTRSKMENTLKVLEIVLEQVAAQ